MLQRGRKEETYGLDDSIAPEIETLVLIDRDIDYVTPMTTPLTYEALIDEIVGIQNSSVTIDRLMLGEDDTDVGKSKKGKEEKKELPPTVTVSLNNNDKLYGDIRDYNISILGRYLSEKSREIRKMYEARPKGTKDMEINELRDFVKKIPSLKESYAQLTLHINMAEKIQNVTNSKAFRDRWILEHKMMDGDKQIDDILGIQIQYTFLEGFIFFIHKFFSYYMIPTPLSSFFFRSNG